MFHWQVTSLVSDTGLHSVGLKFPHWQAANWCLSAVFVFVTLVFPDMLASGLM